MQDNERIEKGKEKIICAVSSKIISLPCAVTTCMWNVNGNCVYRKNAEDIDLGLAIGMSLNQTVAEIRRARGQIIRILILDEYINWCMDKYRLKKSVNKRLEKNTFVCEAFDKTSLSKFPQKISKYHFCLICKKSTYEKFCKERKNSQKLKVASTIGLREKTLDKLRKILRTASVKNKSKTKVKQNE